MNYSNQNKNNFGFINRETIAEAGWIDLNNRFYMPELMRFGQTDPIIKGQEHLSLYQYGWNNPVRFLDPNGDFCIPCIVVLGGLLLASQPAMSPSGGANAKQEQAAYKQAYNDMGSDVIGTLIPGAKSKGATQALYAAAKKEVKEEVTEQTKKIVDKTSSKSTNKNANDAEGNFVLYEVKDKNGKPLKVGKADADRTNAVGQPVRMRDSERKAQKTYPEATSEKVQELGRTTTGQAKNAEATRVKEHRANGNELPLNRENDKRYQN